MEGLYSNHWTNKHGGTANQQWVDFLSTVPPAQIKTGIENLRARILTGNAYAPSLAEFISLCSGATDLEGAYFRCLNKKPEGRVEKWVFENAFFNMRSASDDLARKIHRKFFEQAVRLDARGELVLNSEKLKSLPPNSVKNLNDLERERFEQKNGKSLNPRIQAIIETKRKASSEF